MNQGAKPSDYNLRSAGPVNQDSLDSEGEEETMSSNTHIHLKSFKVWIQKSGLIILNFTVNITI